MKILYNLELYCFSYLRFFCNKLLPFHETMPAVITKRVAIIHARLFNTLHFPFYLLTPLLRPALEKGFSG